MEYQTIFSSDQKIVFETLALWVPPLLYNKAGPHYWKNIPGGNPRQNRIFSGSN